MNKTALIAAVLVAALSLSGCGIYTSVPLDGIPNVPKTGQMSGTGSGTEVNTPELVTPAPAKSAASRLTKTEAEAVALNHAGFAAEQVKGLRSELDIDPGIAHYEVEFRVGQWEYEYDIHAETGEVLAFEKDN